MSAEAEDRLKAREDFLRLMSHEIRTPLNGVLGMLGLLARTRLDGAQRAYLGAARESAEHLLTLVNDLLDFAKIEAGRLELERAPVDLEVLVQSVAELLSPRAHEKNIEIVWAIDPQVPTPLADEGRLRQILFNLAGNAVKFTETGGVLISVDRKKPRADDKVTLRFSVKDTGPGVPAAAKSKIFEEFGHADPSHASRYGGAGLGLAVVKRLAEAMDGRLGVESKPGEGATFWVEAEFEAAEAPRADKSLAGLTVAVASPCALVISTPATLLSAIANAARRGVLFKGGEPMERLATIQSVAIDKTGTLTEGKLEFTDMVSLPDASESEAWQMIIDVESRSEHPLAQALVQAAQARGYEARPVERVEAVPGKGVIATLPDGVEARIGNLRLFEDVGVPESVQQTVQALREAGKTAMIVWAGGRYLAVAAAADKLRPEAPRAVAQLHALGIPCVAMLTGDAEPIARAVAQQTGVDRVYADLLPHEKLEVLGKLSAECGVTAMVGDGVNDAPALAAAEVGIAMGAGTDVALETADVALVGNDLTNLPYAIALSRHAMHVLKQNLIFATGVIVVLVILTFVANLRLPLGVVGHEGSTLIVVMNGLRLLWYRPRE